MPAFNIDHFCKAVQRYKITFTYVAPPVRQHGSFHNWWGANVSLRSSFSCLAAITSRTTTSARSE
jgi:hypothetical protein